MTAEEQLLSYTCSKTGQGYDLTEYVNDINREYTEVLAAYTVNSGASESYSYAGDMRLSRNNIWKVSRDHTANQTSYYLYDGRGSVTANTWYNGMVTSVYQYDPYGQVELGSTEHTEFYGYNGESYNPNTGLEYLRARYYNADQGRFFQEDTYLGDICEPLTLNRYAYGKNSPLNYVDPSGNHPLIVGGALLGFATSAAVSAGTQHFSGKGIDPVLLMIDGIAGAAVGGMTGAGIFDKSILGAVDGAITSAGHNLYNQYLSGEEIDWSKALVSMISGALKGSVFFSSNDAAAVVYKTSVISGLESFITDIMDGAGVSEAAERAITQGATEGVLAGTAKYFANLVDKALAGAQRYLCKSDTGNKVLAEGITEYIDENGKLERYRWAVEEAPKVTSRDYLSNMDLTGVSVNVNTSQAQLAIFNSKSISSLGSEFTDSLNSAYQFNYLTFAKESMRQKQEQSPLFKMDLQVFADKGGSDSDLGNYKFKEGIDEDLRGGRGTFDEALEKAFEKTGTPKEDFSVTKWGKDQYGKSHPVEWRASNGAEVSVDIGHSTQSGAPTADHVGWQTGGKRSSGGGVRGHIFVDEVPYNR